MAAPSSPEGWKKSGPAVKHLLRDKRDQLCIHMRKPGVFLNFSANSHFLLNVSVKPSKVVSIKTIQLLEMTREALSVLGLLPMYTKESFLTNNHQKGSSEDREF